MQTIKKFMPYFLFFTILCTLDITLRTRWYLDGLTTLSYIHIMPMLFTFVWSFLLSFILIKLPQRFKLLYASSIGVLFMALFIAHNVFYYLWGTFFDYRDLMYAFEGKGFAKVTAGYITTEIWLIIIISLILFATTLYLLYKEKSSPQISKKSTIIGITIICIYFLLGHILIGFKTNSSEFYEFSNRRNIYNSFSDNKRAMMMLGMYEYSFRNFTVLIKLTDKKTSIKEIKTYYKQNKLNQKSDLNGMFKDKNVIVIMLEGMDSWLINDKSTPTLNKLKNNSIDFNNYYAVSYTSGYTLNSEFIANTGLIPSKDVPKSVSNYNRNYFPYALPKLFKEAGYQSDSFHMNHGYFYNRDNLHVAFGYDKHYSRTELNFKNVDPTLDTSLINKNSDLIIKDDKFYSFIVTYSAHLPFNKTVSACKKHYTKISKLFDAGEEEYLCSLSQAHETDLFVKDLLKELEKKGKQDDTVLVFFTDHYSYSINEDLLRREKNVSNDYELLKVPFFIWSSDTKHEVINTQASQINVLPTLADLFGLDYQPNKYFGNSIFASNYNDVVIFNDNSWYDGKNYYTADDVKNNPALNEQKMSILKDRDINTKILTTDYYRHEFN